MHWLILPGMNSDQRHWSSFAERLSRELPEGASLLRLDLPGFGSQHRRHSPWSISAIGEDLRRRWFLGRDSRPGPWGLLGHSLGGMIGMRWCERHPDDFARLVLVNSSAMNTSPPHRRMSLTLVPDILEILMHPDAEVRSRTYLKISTRLVDPERLLPNWVRYLDEHPPSKRSLVAQFLAASRFRAPSRLKPRTRVLCSEGDAFTDPSCSRLLARRLGAPVHVHPTAGHELLIDDPDWTVQELLDFL